MISVELARRLRDSGLAWIPAEGDRFVIPDRGLEDQIFSISEMTIDVKDMPGGRQIAFNGTVEWALDSIREHEVVWLPSETQLRDRLGETFVSLTRTEDGYRCTIRLDDETADYESEQPADAYGLALLDLISDTNTYLRLLVGE